MISRPTAGVYFAYFGQASLCIEFDYCTPTDAGRRKLGPKGGEQVNQCDIEDFKETERF